ncbi:DNA-binding transcriptional LysR family regulator [Actinoplanes octamycinicus]|uniref:DNA-binding transcriptional LysR family regulator n=1 Tax=Actinoplanes octamycinicus TaxID=135948 RepID=A0A7W7MCN9_9ACTN|nr:LysR family transcriptional regulator [Actinoplanes octamycinicus]MBB4745293.1 DNA-binding transcriptional LysR family regulator [Actinoplanes octamycinicus]GIE62228.1 LysR family transcriptional regulator [Actinoplanes octamycinicus]
MTIKICDTCGVELRQLEYFVAVAEEQHFSRAAERLHVVQSAVSAAIKTLERELGVPLFDRNAKRVLLTDAGAALLPRARTALDAARDARDAVDEVRGGLRGTLRLGVLTSIRLLDLPALLGEYHRRHPGVLLQTSAAPSGSAGLVTALTEHRLDLAFVSLPGPPPPGIRLLPLASAQLDLVVPPGHPLAGRESVPITELAGLDFIDSPAGYGNRAVADRAFAAAGVRRRVTIEISDIGTGADYVRHGLGITLLPRFLLDGITGVAVLPVTGADLRWPLSLAMPADRTPGAATRALIDLVS